MITILTSQIQNAELSRRPSTGHGSAHSNARLARGAALSGNYLGAGGMADEWWSTISQRSPLLT
jgi:hypothetical protein